MIVDASAAVDFLVNADPRGHWARELLASAELHAPELLEFEVTSALRGLVRARRLRPDRARGLLQDLAELDLVRYPPHGLLERIWELRDRLTAYDAAYVALAEALDAPLVTTDDVLARLRGHRAEILAFPG
jgi:predicted nucleic acid-binding protein